MEVNEIITQTRRVISGYEKHRFLEIAAALREIWLSGTATHSAQGVKRSQRERYTFAGIAVRELRAIGKVLGMEGRSDGDSFLPLALILWNDYGREGRIVAVSMLGRMSQACPEKIFTLSGELVKRSVSWEDCDHMSEAVEPLLRKAPEQYLPLLSDWLHDENNWKRRSACITIGRLPLKRPEYTKHCLDLVAGKLRDPDHEVRRSVSFAVRVCARRDTAAVKRLLRQHAGSANEHTIWILSDVIRSMSGRVLPDFKSMCRLYQRWEKEVTASRSKKSLQSAIRRLESVR